MTVPEHDPPSSELIADFHALINCTSPAKFILWEDEDPALARRSESGVPCGSELLSRGRIRGWEVCERCVKNPLLKFALLIRFK